jgi:hypothetical protein
VAVQVRVAAQVRMAAQVRVAGQVRMAAQVRMGVRFGWRRGVDRRAGLGPAAAGDRVATLWFGWRGRFGWRDRLGWRRG